MGIERNGAGAVQVEFGKGDVMVGAGMMQNTDRGIITLSPSEAKAVGEMTVHHDPLVTMSEVPVSLVFENVESLDVLIRRLNVVRKYMTNELDISKGEYE